MSYDLTLFSLKENIDVSLVVEQLLETDWDDDLAGELLNPVDLQMKKTIVVALSSKYPSLNIFPPSFLKDTAESTSESRENEPDVIELTDLSSTGIQISIFPTSISISWPYWHQGTEADKVVSAMKEYLAILAEVWPCQVYDPQLGQLLETNTDFERTSSVTSFITGLFQKQKHGQKK